MIDPRWIASVGLLCDVAGGIYLAKALLISKDDAVELGVAHQRSMVPEANLTKAPVADRLKQSRNATIGLPLLVFGFLLQLLATWWSALWHA
jgi:hypothetical protein